MKLKQGTKFDSGKIRLDLMSFYSLLKIGEVYTIGSIKYEDHNWRKGMKFSRMIGAALRHLFAYACGEIHDPKDGQHHLSSVAWCAMSLMELEISHPEYDDRHINKEVLEEVKKILNKEDTAIERISQKEKSKSSPKSKRVQKARRK